MHHTQTALERRFCVAPMLDWTDRHCRYWLRLLSSSALLYTEMLTTGALLHGDRTRFLAHDPAEHPLAVQLGGSDPQDMAVCARIVQEHGFDEVNINVGCPSTRVQSGAFGACLMAKPQLVADCVAAMRAVVQIPVTVKTRIGIDDLDRYADLQHFVATVATAGCETFIIHARKAWLQGLSPRQNRELPPLCYERVYRLKRDFPQLTIVLNGGVRSVDDVLKQLQYVDGVMVGREIYQNPYAFSTVQQRLFGNAYSAPTRDALLRRYLPYVREQVVQGVPLRRLVAPLLGLFRGQFGAKRWRRVLTEGASGSEAGVAVIEQALVETAGLNPKD